MQNVICPDHNPNKKPCYYFIDKGFCSSGRWFRCMEYIRRKMPVMSYSAVTQYTRCRYQFYNSWIIGWETTKLNIKPSSGSLFHAYLGTHHSNTEHGVIMAKQDIEKYTAKLINPDDAEGRMFLEGEVVPYMFQGYRKACKEGKIRDFKGISEFPRLIEYDNFTLKARIDLGITDKKNNVRELIDFKFVKSEQYYTFFTTRLQAAIYFTLNPTAEKMTYRCIRRPMLKQGRNETLQKFLKRVRRDVYNRPGFYVKDSTYYRREYDFDRLLAEISRMADEIRENVDNSDFWYQSSSESCLIPWKCDFYDACTSGVWGDNIYQRRTYDVEPASAIK